MLSSSAATQEDEEAIIRLDGFGGQKQKPQHVSQIQRGAYDVNRGPTMGRADDPTETSV